MFDHLDMPSKQANPDLLAMSDLPVMPCLLAVSDLLANPDLIAVSDLLAIPDLISMLSLQTVLPAAEWTAHSTGYKEEDYAEQSVLPASFPLDLGESI